MVFNVLMSNVEDHLHNHRFLWSGQGGWILRRAQDLYPTPVYVKALILTTIIDLGQGACSVKLLPEAAGYSGLGDEQARVSLVEASAC